MRRIPIYFLLLAGLVTVHAQDMDAMKYFNLGISSTNTPIKIEYFTVALQLNPGLEAAYEKRGLLYYFQEKYDKVIQDFERYVKLVPTKPDGYHMLGVGYLKNGIYNSAIFNFTRALKMDPHLSTAYSNRAEAYRLSGNFKSAISDATKAIGLGGNLQTISDAYRTRAKAYLEIKKTIEAYADIKQALDLDPRMQWFLNKKTSINPLFIMGLFILNAMVWFFVFEQKLTPPRIRKTSNCNLLTSKLYIPQHTDAIIRKRLHHLLADIPKKPLTTIVAGAGYGKTTLIAQAARHFNLKTTWYRLDSSDSNVTIFLSYLTAGLRKHFPKFGYKTLRNLSKDQSLSGDLKALLTIFLNELESIDEKNLIIIFDDYHTVQCNHEVKSCLNFLLTHIPSSIHMVLISRFDINLQLSRLRASRKTVDITESDLVFTTDEIDRLYSQLFHISLKQEHLEVLQQKTEGWVSGLILFFHAVKGKNPGDMENLLLTAEGSQKYIFSYLEENVYDTLTAEQKDFIVKTSILPRMSAEFCDQFLNISHSRDVLKTLKENHLFIGSFDQEDKWYVYHHLFRDFLLEKLSSEWSCQAVIELYKRAANLFESSGENEGAFRYYSNIESFATATQLLKNKEPMTGSALKFLPKPENIMISDVPIDRQSENQKITTPCLKVHFFGKFRLFKGDEEIFDKRWKSKKALMIFKYLVFSRQKGFLKKDVFMELLWPEEDPFKTAKRFHVALASLRKTLEPDISRGTPSAYVLRSGDAYIIDIKDEGWVDIECFKEELTHAKKGKNSEISSQHYLKAESLYGGAFLEEDLYIPWCDETRERFKEEYIQLLEEIIKHHSVKKDFKKCIEYAKKYLAVDKYAEDVYQFLMICYSKIGNKVMIKRTYNNCKDNIVTELDCPLSKDTETLYQELISK